MLWQMAMIFVGITIFHPFAQATSLPINKPLTLQKLRQYCQACHAVEELRFIPSDNNEQMWWTIFNERSPKSGKLWVEAILKVLDWPNDTMPPFQSPISPGNDWMPKGKKRIDLAKDHVDGIAVRKIILETLKNSLRYDSSIAQVNSR